MKTVITKSGHQITLDDGKPLGSGGAGTVYRIVSPSYMTNMCVKIYKKEHRSSELQRKIQYQVDNPPSEIKDGGDFVLCLPRDVVFVNGEFVGFVMPMAFADSVSLKVLSSGKIPNHTNANIKNTYDRSDIKGGVNRLGVCVNLAHAVFKLHGAGYVIIDLKPENFMVDNQNRISVLDLDNVQVCDKTTGNLLFHAELATLDYQPIEGSLNKVDPKKDKVDPSWDYFSIAIIFYQILYGIHPYRASFKPPYDNIQSEHKAVMEGLYVHGTKSSLVDVRPPQHDNVTKSPIELQKLFMEAFDIGLKNPSKRPSCDKFGWVFYTAYDTYKKQYITPQNNSTNHTTSASQPVRPQPRQTTQKSATATQTLASTKPPAKNKTTNKFPIPKNRTLKQTATPIPPYTPSKSRKTWIGYIAAIIGILFFARGFLVTQTDDTHSYAEVPDVSMTAEPADVTYSDHDYYSESAEAAREAAAAMADAATSTTYQYNNDDIVNRFTHAPNGELYPDGAGHVPGYPKLNTNGHSIVTILNNKNDYTIFGELIEVYDSGEEEAVRTFYIPPYGGLNLRDLDRGTYKIHYEIVDKDYHKESQSFTLNDIQNNSGIKYQHITINIKGNGNYSGSSDIGTLNSSM